MHTHTLCPRPQRHPRDHAYNDTPTYLRGVDDGREISDTVHAQIGDGEGPALKLMRLEFAAASFLRQLLHICTNESQRL